MKLSFDLDYRVAAVILLSAGGLTYGDTAKPPHGKSTNMIPQVAEVEIPKSVFDIPSQPSEGRNPFFPQSNNGFQAPAPNKPLPSGDSSLVVLNGITSPPRRTAMINGRTFEVGESAEVKLSNGDKALVKCEQIGNDFAVILINGQRHEVRLRSGL